MKAIFWTVLIALMASSYATPVLAAKGGGGHGSGGSGHSSGSSASDHHQDDHGDEEEHSDDHGDDHEGGKKGPQYRGGNASHPGHTNGGNGVEDEIFHGKHGARWSDDWQENEHHDDHEENGDTHD